MAKRKAPSVFYMSKSWADIGMFLAGWAHRASSPVTWFPRDVPDAPPEDEYAPVQEFHFERVLNDEERRFFTLCWKKSWAEVQGLLRMWNTVGAPEPAEPALFAWGTRVRWSAKLRKAFPPNAHGVVTGPPLGSPPSPPGGLYVLWKGLREPMAVFMDDLERVE